MSTLKSDFLIRSMKYCADMEKSTYDVSTKLESWGASPQEIEEILQKLRSDKFLDDTRYVKSYVSDKWNLDHWGKIKIENTLSQKKFDGNLIRESLQSIDDDEYKLELHEILRKKWKEVKSDNNADDAKRVMMFALSRGFEEELIHDWLSEQDLIE